MFETRFVSAAIALLAVGALPLAGAADEDPKVDVVKNYISALNAADIDVIKAMYSIDATAEDPVGSEVLRGHEAVVRLYADGAFRNKLRAELTGPVRIAGNSAAFSLNVYANGMKMEVIDVFQFNDENKVTSLKAYWSFANVKPVDQQTPVQQSSADDVE